MSEITQILDSIQRGQTTPTDALQPLVYEELRQLAARQVAEEAPGSAPQPTALVPEAWLRLAGQESQPEEGRGHYLAAAADAMRRIRVDHALGQGALPPGAVFERISLEDLDRAVLADGVDFLRINEALDKLDREDSEVAQMVRLRFFAGLSIEDAGQAVGVNGRTAKRYWTFARGWLLKELGLAAAGN